HCPWAQSRTVCFARARPCAISWWSAESPARKEVSTESGPGWWMRPGHSSSIRRDFMKGLTTSHQCIEDVAAYLDGELDNAALEVFEGHVKTCAGCAQELRTQRQLLCTLNRAFEESGAFELPQDFARLVATHAESDVTGLRGRGERRRAFKVCAVLALLSFALLAAASRAT